MEGPHPILTFYRATSITETIMLLRIKYQSYKKCTKEKNNRRKVEWWLIVVKCLWT